MRRSLRLGLLLAGNIAALLLLNAVMNPPRWLPPTADPHVFLEAIAQRHTHGPRDAAATPDQLSQIAAQRPVESTCGPVARWAVDLLTKQGYEARMVSTLTLDEWNDTDNGHTLVAVKIRGHWSVFDIDRGVRFTDHDGEPLSLAEWIARVPTDDYLIAPIEPGAPSANELYPWYRRVAQVPLIHEDGLAWFWSAEAERVSAYAATYSALPRGEWTARFYP